MNSFVGLGWAGCLAAVSLLACSSSGGGSDGGTAGAAGAAGSTGSAGSSGSSSVSATPFKVSTAGNVLDLTLQGGSVYWTESGGQVLTVPTSGGTPVTVFEGPAVSTFAAGITADAQNVYFTEMLGKRVMKVPLAGGAATQLGGDATCGLLPPIAIDNANVYWFASCDPTTSALTLKSAPIAGGAETVIATGMGRDFYPAQGGNVDAVRALAISGNTAYWTNLDGAVSSLPLTGATAPTEIDSSTGVAGGTTLVIHGSKLYFEVEDYMLQHRGAIQGVSLDGTNPTTVVMGQDLEQQSVLAVDDKFAYFATNRAVFKVPVGGGTPVMLADSRSVPNCLAVDSAAVYWAESGVGIWRIAK